MSSALLEIESWASAIINCAKLNTVEFRSVCKCLLLWNNKLILQIYISKMMILFLKLWAPFVNTIKD
jgi:hypothetical protein